MIQDFDFMTGKNIEFPRSPLIFNSEPPPLSQEINYKHEELCSLAESKKNLELASKKAFKRIDESSKKIDRMIKNKNQF